MKNNPLIRICMIALLALPLIAEEGPEQSAPKLRSLEELFTGECECKVPHYSCDKCRYELGLVKLDATLIRTAQNTNGLIVIKHVEKSVAQLFLLLNGEIALNQAAVTRVSPRISGIVRTVYVEQGAQVKKDEILLEIESAELGHAIGGYRKNKALSALALKNLERENMLAKKMISPEIDRLDAQIKYDEYRLELESARNTLAVMGLNGSAIDSLTSDANAGNIGTLPVRASLSGSVIKKNVTPGEAVEAGKELMVIADLSTVWVWMSLYEQDLARLIGEANKAAPRVRITTGAFPDKTFEGVVDLIGSTMDEDSRTVKVRALLKNSEALLRPGMFCEARVAFATQEKVVAVPKNALLSDEGKHFVFRLIRDGFALRTDVEVGREFADSVEVTGGLSGGEKIVTEGAFVLKSDVLRAKMGAGCAD
ncbi:MAG: efflux RND transporter periplasmic adaptor subunit [bacterium]